MLKRNLKVKIHTFLGLILLATVSGPMIGGGCVFPGRTVMFDTSKNIGRAGPDVVGHIYYFNAAGKMELTKGKVHIPEGTYFGPRRVE